MQPVAWWGRYTIYVVAPAAVATMWLLDSLRRRPNPVGLLSPLSLVLVAATAVWPVPGRFWYAPAGVPTSAYGPGTGHYLTPPQLFRDAMDHQSPDIEQAAQYHWLRGAPPGSRIMVTKLSPHFVGPLYGRDGSNSVVLVDAHTATEGVVRLLTSRRIGYAWLRRQEPLAVYALAHPTAFELIGQGGGADAFRLCTAGTSRQHQRSQDTRQSGLAADHTRRRPG